MTKNPLVSVLILTYDHTDLLKDCLTSALRSDYPNLEFIISDNGSKEDIAGFVAKNFPQKKINRRTIFRREIKVVRLKKNKGLTGGFNYGFKFCKGKYVMLLSNDTKIDKIAISLMVQMMERDPKIGIVSPKIIQMKNPELLHNAGSYLTYFGLLYHYGILQNKDDKKYQKDYFIFSCNGAGFLVRKEAIQRCGLFEEDFFYFYDDSDLSHRIWLGGYTIVYNHKAHLWHLWSGTMQGANPQIWYYNHRNHLSSLIRNLSLPYLLLILFNTNLILLFWFFKNLFRLKLDVAVTIPKAYLWHILNVKLTLSKRKIVQNNVRKVSDSEIFKKCLVSPPWSYCYLYLHLIYRDMRLPKRVMYLK